MRAAAFCLLLLAGPGALAEDVPVIGRLFAPAGAKAAGRADGSRIRVDGAVARSSGRNTVWLNGEAHHEGARISPAQLPAVTLRGNRPTRVGETLDLESGERRDLLPPAAIVRGK